MHRLLLLDYDGLLYPGQPKVQRAPKLRNPIVRAIAARVLSVGAGRHKPPRGARRRAQEIDLAQRVRESKEW